MSCLSSGNYVFKECSSSPSNIKPQILVREAGRQAGRLSERADSSIAKMYRLRKVQLDNNTKPYNLIGGCEGRVEDIYQRDTGHNALCLIG